MKEPVAIQYREFYDIPRMFIATFDGFCFLFDAPFDVAIDDYPDDYDVLLLPTLSEEDLSGSWTNLPRRAVRRLGRVKANAIVFDSTRRKSIDAQVLRELIESNSLTAQKHYG